MNMESIFVLLCIIVISGIGYLMVSYFSGDKDVINQMSFRETMDLCELPIVTFVNNGKKLNFLLDTGASKSVIHNGTLEGLDYKYINKSGNLYGIDGKKQNVQFISMPIEYKGKNYNEEFQSIDMSVPFSNLKSDFGVNLHGILSSTFFQKYKYVLNFDELIAYSMV